jgi:Tfp pilus assembly PilM family ATPase
LHAEANAITKLAMNTVTSSGSTMYVTLSPCFECAKLIIQSGIKSFFENEVLRIINQFQNNNKEKIQDIVLLGGFAKMDGIREFVDLVVDNQLGSSQKINITVAEPYSNLSIKGVKDKKILHSIWHDLVLSIGISLKDYVE